jgi:acyl-CoA synthetase (AMP-forming)/AMP-acid ligase II
MVLDPNTMEPVPTDGESIGEIMFRGNIAMKGYLKNPAATEEAFRGGWFHSGDLGVVYPDGYVRIKDRSKDIIISGENISSLEVEDVLYRHPDVLAAAVVAKSLRVRRAETRRDCHRPRPHRALQSAPGRLQGAARSRILRVAENGDRQNPEIRVAQTCPVCDGYRRMTFRRQLRPRFLA